MFLRIEFNQQKKVLLILYLHQTTVDYIKISKLYRSQQMSIPVFHISTSLLNLIFFNCYNTLSTVDKRSFIIYMVNTI